MVTQEQRYGSFLAFSNVQGVSRSSGHGLNQLVPLPPERSSVELVIRINSIRERLTQTLNGLRVKIKTLETERALLLREIRELKRAAKLRASALESEVSELREEINSLRELLGQSAREA